MPLAAKCRAIATLAVIIGGPAAAVHLDHRREGVSGRAVEGRGEGPVLVGPEDDVGFRGGLGRHKHPFGGGVPDSPCPACKFFARLDRSNGTFCAWSVVTAGRRGNFPGKLAIALDRITRTMLDM